MKCPNCGKEIADNRNTCPYCGVTVGTSSPWYTKWWIWVIAAVAVAGIVVTCILTLGSCGKSNNTAKPVATTVGTTAAVTESTGVPGKSIEQIIADGYEKIGPVKLFNNINKYKGKKILTAIVAKDISADAIYSTLEDNAKVLTRYKFNMANKKELENAKKGDYVAVYGTVSKNGAVVGSIDVDSCHVAATGSDAKLFFDTIKDDKPATTAPTTKPATTAPTTKPATTAATAAPTTVPATTAAPTQATQPSTAPDANTLFNENNIVIRRVALEEGDTYVTLKLRYSNQSGSDYYLSAENCTVNGKSIDLQNSDFEAMGSNTSGETNLYLSRSDLDEAGISSVDELRFRFVLNDAEDWQSSITSKEIVITP